MKRILIIDDDQTVRQSTARFLERSGYQLYTAASGSSGLRICDEHPIDLVITDIFMPDSDGIEVIMALRQNHPRIPLITISGGPHNNGESAFFLQTAIDLGAHHAIKKPFSHDELLVAVSALLEHPV
ncbi:response regulator [Candidatus Magnetaquicoccus inordinatus]|uniref:response regulator n=1 Tax=Candidatus Magnetaquicoccus inordinatus TaxID=2496818 RepID=UPI00102CF8BB|nr:response regulator [Candidatus Magnetaquicoccus inordinatus]